MSLEKQECLVVGAGGHGRVVISILSESSQNWNPVGVYDPSFTGKKEVILGVPLVGDLNDLLQSLSKRPLPVFIGIGDNASRKSLYEKLCEQGVPLPNLISASAYVAESAKLGSANLLAPHSHLGPQASIGSNNILNTGANLEHEVWLGDHSHVSPGVHVGGRSKIGDSCHLGIGSSVIHNIQIGSKITCGAGAAVVTDLRIPGLYLGVPAKRRDT